LSAQLRHLAQRLAPLLDGSTAGELIPELVRHGLQQLIELEVAAMLGAERHERSEERLGYRNGYRPRLLTTQVGDIPLAIPKLRSGSFLPSILEPRRRVDQALYAVVMEAYVAGVSTRKVDALVAALGSQSRISKSQVSRICADIDVQLQAFLAGLCRPAATPIRSHQRDPADAARQLLAALPRALCPQPVAAGAQGASGHGHRRSALGVRLGEGL
jgi:hypothetical protein